MLCMLVEKKTRNIILIFLSLSVFLSFSLPFFHSSFLPISVLSFFFFLYSFLRSFILILIIIIIIIITTTIIIIITSPGRPIKTNYLDYFHRSLNLDLVVLPYQNDSLD